MYNNIYSPFSFVEQSLNSLAKDLFNEVDASPKTNYLKSEKGNTLQFLVPGTEKSDFQIESKGGILKVIYKAENKEVPSFVSDFEQSYKLGKNYDVQDIKAEHKNGILSVHIVRKTPVEIEAKTIDIK